MMKMMKAMLPVAVLLLVPIVAGCSTSPATATSVPTTATPAPSPTATVTPPTTVPTTATATPTPTVTQTPTTPAPVTAAGSPSVSIIEPPSQGWEFVNNVSIIVRVSNFKLVNKAGQANVPGEGHLIYYLDVQPPTTPGRPAFTAPGTYAVSTNTTYIWSKLFHRGAHTLSVQVVNNDNTPLSPAVTAQVAMNVNS